MNVVFPDWFDEYEWETIAKGYFIGVTLEVGTARYKPVFYDPARLAQEVEEEVGSSNGYFVEPNMVVVEVVDRSHIQKAANSLAAHGFEGLTQFSS
jgi:hypothetical protein